MKIEEIRKRLYELIPSECPHCGVGLENLADWQEFDELLDLVLSSVDEPTLAKKEAWLKTGYKIGREEKRDK